MPEQPIGIVVAVREEFWAVGRRLAARRLGEGGDPNVATGNLCGRGVILVRAGMGAERAEAAVHRLVLRDGASRLIVAGFCAGLAPQVAPGDVVWATGVESTATRTVWTPHGGPQCTSSRDAGAYRVHAGSLLTTETVVDGPSGKREMVSAHPQALALDMETAGAAKAACELGVPWAAIRAVTDGAGHRFPLDFSTYSDPKTGDVRRIAVVVHVLAHPWLIPALVQLGLRSSRAARNLASFVEEYVGTMASSSTPRAR